MTVQTFCRSGEHEEVKGAVHALTGVLALVMASYNAAAWCYRRQPHLATNAILYGVVCAWEIKQTMHHVQRCTCEAVTDAAA